MIEEMNIFEKLANNIITDGLRKEIREINQVKKSSKLNMYAFESIHSIDESTLLKSIKNEEENSKLLKAGLRKYFNRTQRYSELIGSHPDFMHLNNNTENHYIISVFVDIKGSTKLATIKNLSLEEVREIKNRTLTTVISIFQVFDGHIHRLQGDAVFAFFGRRKKPKEEAIIDALNAVTILQYVFQNVLSKIFEEADLPSIDIRTGLDFGDDNDVLWSKYGVDGCNEITTTSIYTDLAAKLQHKARSNNIMIGDNIKKMLDLPEDFYRKKTKIINGNQEDEEYILNYREFKYKMWEFNWNKYISFFPQLPNNQYTISKYNFFPYKDFILTCQYEDKSGNIQLYERNSKVIPKGVKLLFSVEFLNPALNKITRNFIWEVNNRGEEASSNGKATKFNTPAHKERPFECSQSTAYKGHHYMNLKIKSNEGRIIAEDNFGIFIA